MKNWHYLVFIIINFSCYSFAEESFEKYIASNCSNVDKIKENIRTLVEFSDYGIVDVYYDDALELINKNCRFNSGSDKEKYLLKFKDLSKKYLSKGRRVKFNYKVKSLESYLQSKNNVCGLSISDINLVKEFSSDYGMKLPDHLNPEKLDTLYKRDVKKIKKNIGKCFSDYIWHLSCGDSAAISLSNLITLAKDQSIEKQTAQIFQKLDSECSDPNDKEIVSALKEYMKEPVEDSLLVEYERQERRMAAVAGKADHLPMLREMERIVAKLKYPDLVERHSRLHQRIRLPDPNAYKVHQASRKNKCTNIDNTNSFVRRDQNQASTDSCFTFGAANLLNYHLGIEGISPLYLFTLAVAENDAPWYRIESGWRSFLSMFRKRGDSISSYTGGYSSGAIEKALERGTYCSTKDVIDFTKDSEKMEKVIIKTESVGASAFDTYENFKQGHMSKEAYRKKNLELFEMIKPYFPKAKISEFNRSLKKYKNGPKFFTDFLFSQCKTPLPKGARGIKVETNYAFSDASSLSLDRLDQLIENQNIAAIGVQSDALFKGTVIADWSPHIVTLTGRRWNAKKNQCEFRIINSWGKACEEVVNPEIECDHEKNELWINENLIIQHGNSLTTIIDSPMIRSRRDSNYEEYDPDF